MRRSLTGPIVGPRFIFVLTALTVNIATAAVTDIVVSEGTNFAVDLSPGPGTARRLVMDLQGLLWTLPAAGGDAEPLTSVTDDIRLPRFSPDGRQIAFQWFRDGAWGIGVMNADGSERRTLTTGARDDREPAWSANGHEILFASDRAGNYDIWSLDLASGALTQITHDPADDYAPAVSVDGERIAFVSERAGQPALYISSDGGYPELIATAPAGRLHAPRFSPDGRSIAFVEAAQRNAFPGIAVNQLVVIDLETGAKTVLSSSEEDVFYFAPVWADKDTLVYSADGAIHKVAIDSAEYSTVPFHARLTLEKVDFTPRTPLVFSQDEQPVLGIVDPIESADGRIIFHALGDLWALDQNGALTQLTNDVFVERDPHVSDDGRYVAFISDRNGGMQIFVRDLTTGVDRQITTNSGGPRYPTFDHGGTRLAFQQVGPRGTQDFTVRVLDLETGKSTRLRAGPAIWPGRMSWSADDRYITVAALTMTSNRFRDGVNRLVRINVDNDEAYANELPAGMVADAGPVISPDGKHTALIIDGALWRVSTAPDGSFSGEPDRVLDALVDSPSFSRDGKRLTFLSNRGLETLWIDKREVEDRERKLLDLDMSWRPAQGPRSSGLTPGHRQIVHAGRLYDGMTGGYRENVDIFIVGAHIIKVAPHREHPSDDVVLVDASDRTVLPGLIDHHVHFEPHKGEWVGRAWLGFGVTTVVEPGGLPYESREIMEAWSSGKRLGPRLVFAGPQLDGARRVFSFASHINSDRRLAWEMARAERLGYGLIKTYTRMPPDRQRKAVIMAHELGLPVTAHAAMRNLAFGGDRVEHLRGTSRMGYSPKQTAMLRTYDDVKQMMVATGATVTPTLVVAGGFFEYALAHPEYAENLQYRSFFPQAYRQGLAGFTKMVAKQRPLIQAGLANAQDTVRQLHDKGVRIVAGTDTPIFPHGLSLIVELANFVDAGMTSHEVLQTATAQAAIAMGAGDEIGRVADGLLADLIIVNGDPLGNINDLFNVTGVMTNGRFYPLEELL